MHVNKLYSLSLNIIFSISLFLPILTLGFTTEVYSQRAGKAVLATDARLSGDVFRTRLIFDLTDKVEFRTFTLANPYRLIVDLKNVSFKLGNGTGKSELGVIKAFRYGIFAPGKSRIVIDLNQPAVVERAYSIDPQKGQLAKLVIDLIPIDRESFLSRQLVEREKRLAEQAKLNKRKKLSNLNPNDPIISEKLKRTNNKPVIIIDPGHGGIDSGALGVAGSKEKNIVLAFGKSLNEILKGTNKYKVYMTRRSDVFIPLKGRVRYARRKNADLFVSIHADSIKRKDPSVRGATVYTLSEKASDREAQALANSENKSDILAGVELSSSSDDVTSILIDLARRETKNHSVAFANILMEAMRASTIVKKNPIRYANFVVLRAPDVPSVLVELGYLSSRNDERLLKSKGWRKKVAKSVAQAIDTYFKKRKSPNTF